MRRLLVVLLPLFAALPIRAQVIRRGSFGAPPPAAWISLGVGHTQGWTVTDGGTGTRWEFGNATQYQGSLEKDFGGFTLGLRGNTASAPLRYAGTGTSAVDPAGTDADARVSQLLAAVHVAGDRGFHTVLELDAGATYYSNFRARTGEVLAPAGDADFTYSFGYGFGYGFSNRFHVEVVQDLTTLTHQRTGLGAGDDSSVRLNSTRVVGRFGLGMRR